MPMPLAIGSYRHLHRLDDDDDVLNLAWTSDERHHLSIDLQNFLTEELRNEAEAGLPFVTSYFVQDPYGEGLLAGAVAEFFGVAAAPLAVTCGAGVGPLLHCLAGLARGAPTYVAGDVYPDLPVWAERSGSRCVTYASRVTGADPAAAAPEEHAAAALALGARLVALERPALIQDGWADLAALRRLCDALAGSGVPVVVDESNANYWPPGFSAVHLVDACPNLVVVRGVSKALGLGGLRFGYCVSRPALAEQLRAGTPPLLASSLSLRLSRAVLNLGDVAGPLRERIRVRRTQTAELLRGQVPGTALAASEFLPYQLYSGRPDAALARLRELGVLAKLQPMWSAAAQAPRPLCRLSVPLDDARFDRLHALLTDAA